MTSKMIDLERRTIYRYFWFPYEDEVLRQTPWCKDQMGAKDYIEKYLPKGWDYKIVGMESKLLKFSFDKDNGDIK